LHNDFGAVAEATGDGLYVERRFGEMMQPALFDRTFEMQNMNDVVHTPSWVARCIVDHFSPSGQCLDPCKGDGAFYDLLPAGSDFCELKDGKDFFNWSGSVDWIVSNPPYSIFPEWLDHSFAVAANIVYLIPIAKVFNSFGIMKRTATWGGIREIFVIGSGRSIGFPFGFALGAIHFQKGYQGDIRLSFRDV
jgi:hypothetical protein